MHLLSCCRCLTSSQSGLCTICISKLLSAPASGTQGCEDEELVSDAFSLFLVSCFRLGSVPTRSRSEFRWHLSSRDEPRLYLREESLDTVSVLRFLLTESKFPWRHLTRSRSLCWYLSQNQSPQLNAISLRLYSTLLFAFPWEFVFAFYSEFYLVFSESFQWEFSLKFHCEFLSGLYREFLFRFYREFHLLRWKSLFTRVNRETSVLFWMLSSSSEFLSLYRCFAFEFDCKGTWICLNW